MPECFGDHGGTDGLGALSGALAEQTGAPLSWKNRPGEKKARQIEYLPNVVIIPQPVYHMGYDFLAVIEAQPPGATDS